jgi:diacylglycerol kinase
MMEFLTSRARSFRNAFSGWWYVIRTQRNAWIHAVISVSVILICLWLKLSMRDWAVICLAIAIVWAAEFFNTALEVMVDLSSPDQHNLAKTSKDVGAAAVLIAAAASVLVGLLILGPPFWDKVKNMPFVDGFR